MREPYSERTGDLHSRISRDNDDLNSRNADHAMGEVPLVGDIDLGVSDGVQLLQHRRHVIAFGRSALQASNIDVLDLNPMRRSNLATDEFPIGEEGNPKVSATKFEVVEFRIMEQDRIRESLNRFAQTMPYRIHVVVVAIK